MLITIENCSSPGASFTDNTNEVIIKCNEWINEHTDYNKSFRQFRKELQSEKGINDNNARNIYPFLKNCGLIKYEAKGILKYNSFFTERGLAYVKTLESIKMLVESTNDTSNERRALEEFYSIKENIIFLGLSDLLKVPDSNYTEEYIACLKFLIKYSSINKVEFAYLLYEKSLDKDMYIANMKDNIELYRNNEIDIEVQVSVRNDIKIREKTNLARRIEGISFLTAYSYILGTLCQCGIVVKNDKEYILPESKKELARKLIKDGLSNE